MAHKRKSGKRSRVIVVQASGKRGLHPLQLSVEGGPDLREIRGQHAPIFQLLKQRLSLAAGGAGGRPTLRSSPRPPARMTPSCNTFPHAGALLNRGEFRPMSEVVWWLGQFDRRT